MKLQQSLAVVFGLICSPAFAQSDVTSQNQSGGVTAGSIGTLNQNFGRNFRSPYLKELQDFYVQGSVLSRSWMGTLPDTKDEEIAAQSTKSFDWVNGTYAWIKDHITPAAAERLVQITPAALSFTLPGTHSRDTQTLYNYWRIALPAYLSNLNEIMRSDEMYPQISLNLQFYLGPGNYEPQSDVAGFKWSPIDTDVRILLVNPTTTTYTNFNAYIATNLSIHNAGVTGTNCSVTSFSPFISSITLQGSPHNLVFPTQVAGGISPTYQIHCDKIIPGTNHEIVVAVIGQKPLPFGSDLTDAFFKKSPDWVAARISYDAPGTHRDENLSHCFAAQCNIPPDATFR